MPRPRKSLSAHDLFSQVADYRRQFERPVRDRIDELERELEQLRAFLKDFAGGGTMHRRGPGRPPGSGARRPGRPPGTARRGPGRPPGSTNKRRRVRRSSEDVNKQAHDMLSDIQGAGKEGIGGGELTRKYGMVRPTIKEFIESRTQAKLKMVGPFNRARYVAQ